MGDCSLLTSLLGGHGFDVSLDGSFFKLQFVSLDSCIEHQYDVNYSDLPRRYTNLKNEVLSRYGVSNLPYFCESLVSPCSCIFPTHNIFVDGFYRTYYDYLLFHNPFFGGDFERRIVPCILNEFNYKALLCFGGLRRIIPICNFYILDFYKVYFNDRFYSVPDEHADGRYYPYSHRFHFGDRGNYWIVQEEDIEEYLRLNDLILVYQTVYDCETNSLNLPVDANGESCCRFRFFGDVVYKSCVCDKLKELNNGLLELL